MRALKIVLASLFIVSLGAGAALAAPPVTLNPTNIPQFVDPLPLLDVQSGTIETVVSPQTEVPIYMKEFKANILPAATKLPKKGAYGGTWVWGYRKADATATKDTYIGPVFVVERFSPTQVQWWNKLPASSATSQVLFWQGATDRTLHWADPLNQGHQMTNYSGPIPAVVHLHGGEVPPQLDGGPDSWFVSDGSAKFGHSYHTKPGGSTANNQATYNYPNSQEAAPIWFHDHALGITRLNVYAGMAGGYIITDPDANPPSLSVLNNAAKIIPIVIQDRMFDVNGQLFFPSAGINPEHPFWVPEFVGDVIVVNGKSWPFLNVGLNTYRFLFLNGSNARAYELDLFDRATGLPGPPMWVIGTDGGYLDNPVMLDPALKQKLIIMPGERYEVIVDFSAAGGYAGQVLELRNTARTPYPGGAPVQGSTTGRVMRFNVFSTANLPATPSPPPPLGYTPVATDTLRTSPIERLTANTPVVNRQLTLNEFMGPGGPLEVLVNNTKWAGHSLPDFFTSPGIRPDFFLGANGEYYSERPVEGQTELWEIINLTADAHPIHLHLVQFQLVNREPFNVKAYNALYDSLFPPTTVTNDPMTGVPYPGGVYIGGFGPPADYNTGRSYDPLADDFSGQVVSKTGAVGGNPNVDPFLIPPALPPLPQEAGWKDTVIMYPGQVTRIMVRWAPTDLPASTSAAGAYFPFNPNGGHGYVWHCHIIDHEDNEMMRPDTVMVNPDAPNPRDFTNY
jgi:spore coat protein A